MLISFISAKGSPGVTTTALAVASRWPRNVLVADLDPLCGDVLAGVCQGRIPARANLGELMVTARNSGVLAALPEQLIKPDWPPGCPILLPGLGAPGQAQSLPWDTLASGLSAVPWADVVADCGRWGTAPSPVPVLAASDLVVLVLRGTLRSIYSAARAVPVLRQSMGGYGPGDALVAVVIGPRQPYTEREISSHLSMPVIGTLPWEPKAAHVWSDGGAVPRQWDHCELQRAASKLATDLRTHSEGYREALHAYRSQPAARQIAAIDTTPSATGTGPVPAEGAVEGDDAERTAVHRVGSPEQVPLRPLHRRGHPAVSNRNGRSSLGEDSR